jgi:peptidoglycan/LPS O-acetylase OafA/YrhL
MSITFATAVRRIPRVRVPVRRAQSGRAHDPSSLRLDELSQGRRRRNNFDLLRLVAATCVVFAHSFDLLKLPEPFPHLAGLGWGTIGVLIFFSISGFLVAGSWDRDPKLIPFAVKRALRLMPGLIVALLLSALVLGPLVTDLPLHLYARDPATKAYVLNNMLLQSDWLLPGVFVHNVYPVAVNGSLWTLPLEVKAYFILALAGLIGTVTHWRWVMLVVAALAILAAIDTVRSALPGGNHFVAGLADIQMQPTEISAAKLGSFTIYAVLFGSFAIGAALYSLRRWVAARWDLAGLAVLAWLVTVIIGGSAPLTGAMIVVPYLVLCLAYRTNDTVRLPGRFGDYSYGVYIYAFPIQQTISYLILPASGWLMFLLAMPITFVAGVLSWHFVEHPALDLKRRLTGGAPPAAG